MSKEELQKAIGAELKKQAELKKELQELQRVDAVKFIIYLTLLK